jgi:predicted lipoprotein with Yx(FWY)xxD motif
MKKALAGIVASAALALLFPACGSGGSKAASKPADASQPPTSVPARTGVSVKVMSSRYGKVIFDGKGRAVYLFTRDRTSRSRCYGDCASAWPPFLTHGSPRARSGVREKLLGTTTRRDGKRQVTYRGQPLYHYEGDREPGEILCQDVVEFGGTWLVVSPSGQAVR